MSEFNRKIVLAACKIYHDEHGEMVLCGHRHWSMDMHQSMDKLKLCGWKVLHEDGAQGFVDNAGRYYTREEAIQFVKDGHQDYDSQRGNHAKSIDDCKEAFSEGFW